MRPRNKVKAPAGRVYKSSVRLKQTKLQPPKKSVRSYGKSTSKRIPKLDSTLTQMDFINLNRATDGEEVEEEEEDLYIAKPFNKVESVKDADPAELKRQRSRPIVEGDEDRDDFMDESEKRKKRRRATGGQDNVLTRGKVDGRRRKPLRDEPLPASKYHTQTLTQMESFSSRSSSPATQEEAETQKTDYDVPRSSQILKLNREAASQASKREEFPLNDPFLQPTSAESMPPPQTPHRITAFEIPSSQSPMTPYSAQSTPSFLETIPFDERDLNAPIPFSTTPKHPKLIARDTFSTAFGSGNTQQSHVPTSPSKRYSPAKSVRFADLEEGGEGEDAGAEKEEEEAEEVEVEPEVLPTVKSEPALTQFPASQQTLSQTRSGDEILDSDAESDMIENDFKTELDQEEDGVSSDSCLTEEEQEPETCYGDLGLETQIEAEQLLSARELSSPVDESQIFRVENGRSQYIESQRISRQQAQLMAPRTTDSDIFISLHPPHIKSIVQRKKDHEFRSWAFPPTVVRIWIYETAPASRLKYMAAIGPVKRPGDILDERGVGNADFNRKPTSSSEYAYEIFNLYELANTRSLTELKEAGILKGPPQKMAWLRPAVLDDLMGNLKPPIFAWLLVDESQSSPSADTQEAEAQLLSTIQQFTQPATPLQVSSKSAKEDSEDEFAHHANDLTSAGTQAQYETPHRIRPSQAETVDLSQSKTPRYDSLPEIIWESPTRPIPSSTPQLPTKVPMTASVRSESVAPFSIASSQFLTKSQMLPDSLLNESVPAPPDFIQDSDEEDD